MEEYARPVQGARRRGLASPHSRYAGRAAVSALCPTIPVVQKPFRGHHLTAGHTSEVGRTPLASPFVGPASKADDIGAWRATSTRPRRPAGAPRGGSLYRSG